MPIIITYDLALKGVSFSGALAPKSVLCSVRDPQTVWAGVRSLGLGGGCRLIEVSRFGV